MSEIKSSSIHNLNADRGLSFFEKPVYLFLNFLNNLFPYTYIDPRLNIKHWSGEHWREIWAKTYPDSSPSRKLSDLFWRTLSWQKIKNELGEINIFDTGCGQGNYGVRIGEGSGWIISSYTGIDAKRRPNWDNLKKEHPNFNFIESNSNDISSLIPQKTNLFVTQSAIEHFDSDLLFFKQIRNFVERQNKPIIQIHLFPAGSTLFLYLFHGLRQYTPRTISKITKLFSDNSKFYLYGLGGPKGKWLHFKYFTWPVLILRKFKKPTFEVSEYEPKLKKAIEHDINNPSKSPIFWALIIQSNPIRQIWK